MVHRISFKHAFDGLVYVVKNHPNMKVHGLATLAALGLGFVLKLVFIEWLIIFFTILLVLTTEMMNTAVESMTDLITTEYRQQAKIAKDVSAGMVLLTAAGSVIIGIIIFLPKILGI